MKAVTFAGCVFGVSVNNQIACLYYCKQDNTAVVSIYDISSSEVVGKGFGQADIMFNMIRSCDNGNPVESLTKLIGCIVK